MGITVKAQKTRPARELRYEKVLRSPDRALLISNQPQVPPVNMSLLSLCANSARWILAQYFPIVVIPMSFPQFPRDDRLRSRELPGGCL